MDSTGFASLIQPSADTCRLKLDYTLVDKFRRFIRAAPTIASGVSRFDFFVLLHVSVLLR